MPARFVDELVRGTAFVVSQKRELAELVGIESGNRYSIETESGVNVGYAAEQSKGVTAFLARQILGHWRTFEVTVFDADRQPVLHAKHPFRWILHELEIDDPTGRRLGVVKQRFTLLSKRFDVVDSVGEVILSVASPVWKLWTFPFYRGDREVACVKKRWSGTIGELLTDADKFRIELAAPELSADERLLIVAASLFIDLIYFEAKAG